MTSPTVPANIQSIVSLSDTKQVILDRFAERERKLREENEELLQSLKKKDQLLESYQTPTSLQQMSISSQQRRNDNPIQQSSQQVITPSAQDGYTISSFGRPSPHTPNMFSGLLNEDINLWLSRMDKFVVDEGLSQKKMVKIASSFLDGAALQWWTDTEKEFEDKCVEVTYELFRNNCIKRWSVINMREKAYDQLKRIVQTDTLTEYNSEFQRLYSLCAKDYANEGTKIYDYTAGLKPPLYIEAKKLKCATLQDCMVMVTTIDDARNSASQIYQSRLSKTNHQKTTIPKGTFATRSFRRGRGTSTPTARRLFVMRNAPVSSEQGLNNVWNEAVQNHGYIKAKQMFANEQCFKCGRKGHRASSCTSQQIASQTNVNADVEAESAEQLDGEWGKGEGRDE